MLPSFFRSLLLMLMSFILITACQTTTGSAPQASLPTLSVGLSTWVGYYPLAIAQNKGFFEQQGVKVDLNIDDSSQYLTNFTNDQLDVAFVTLGNAVIMGGQNGNIWTIALVDESAGADAVVADASIREVADLRGKRLGVKIAEFGELFVTQALKAHGLSEKDVSLVDVEAASIPSALAKKTIQAGHTWEPFVSEVKKSGQHVLFTSKETPGLISDVIVTKEEVLRQHPEAVRAFIRAWFQAVDYWQGHEAESNTLIAQVFKVDPKTISTDGLKLSTLAENRHAFNLTPASAQPSSPDPSSQSSASLTPLLHDVTKLYSDFFIRTGSLSHPLDPDKLLDASYLPAA